MAHEELERLRKEIELADEALLEALSRRMNLVEAVAKCKEELGMAVLDAGRERQLITRLSGKAAERDLNIGLVERLLRAVIAHSRHQQSRRRSGAVKSSVKGLSFSFQGEPGAYSWIAARRHLGSDATSQGEETFEQALEQMLSGRVERAVLPVQNTLAGSIHPVYSLLSRNSCHVVGEEFLRIDHCLVGLHGAVPDSLQRIYSHPVALRQCRLYMATNPERKYIATVDTAEAARRIKEEGKTDQAAIASAEAARLSGLEILEEGIADHPENYTRFWIVSRDPVELPATTRAITSILLVTSHSEGALVKCLKILSDSGINLLKLESHPREGIPWEHSFYIDLEGNMAEERLRTGIEQLSCCARDIRILGCYPRGER